MAWKMMAWTRKLLLLLLLLVGAWRVAAGPLEVSGDARCGATIAVDGSAWLVSDDVLFGGFRASAGTLTLLATRRSSGADALGAFEQTACDWANTTTASLLLTTRIKVYEDNFVVFEQHFGAGWRATEAVAEGSFASTVYPAFNKTAVADRPCFAYGGTFPQMVSGRLREYEATFQGGAPLVVYEGPRALVFSPLDAPKAQHMASSEAWFGAGAKSTALEIPPATTLRWILVVGGGSSRMGVRAAMDAWGALVLKFHGVKDESRANMYRDAVHGAIGYWTDNGGYYHYSTGHENNKKNRTYEEVLPEVKRSHDAAGVAFGHWQFDSWFYPKDGPVSHGGGGGAVLNWTALPAVFPSGMAGINVKLDGMPMVMHNRQWSPVSDYVKSPVASFAWATASSAAIPLDPEGFFTWFFQQQAGWGLAQYEQDWMSKQYEKCDALQQNLTLADSWLRGMALGVLRSNRTQQYCMPFAYDVLAAAEFPAVTTARATGDYFHAEDQWAVGATALFYAALGILPFKDGFYSSTRPQQGGQTVGPETNPDREILMAVLSGGSVAAMDGIHLLNASRVLASCRKDGVVLKPDRPLRTVDWCFAHGEQRPEACFVYETEVRLEGYGTAHLVYSDALFEDIPRAVFLGSAATSAPPFVLYNWYTGLFEGSLKDDGNAIRPGYEGHAYALALPVVRGWVFLGEVAKYVPVSTLRFARFTLTDDDLKVDVAGVANETVRACAARVTDSTDAGGDYDHPPTITCGTVHFDQAEAQQLRFVVDGGPATKNRPGIFSMSDDDSGDEPPFLVL